MSEVLGIDLGTTYTVVGVWVSEAQAQTNSSETIVPPVKVEIIANKQGSRKTPSCVAFTETERLIGIPAKNQILANPENTIVDSKRLIGLDFMNESVQNDIKQWPFKVINDDGPKFVVNYKNERKTFSPVETSVMILTYVKEFVECYRGKSVTDAVITVPAYFNSTQREATKVAGQIAGLNVLRIINEPTAAALAYGLNEKKEENVVVFDLGGGTFDVSVLTIDDGVFNVISTAGNNHLGGEDFNNCILDHFINEFKKSNNECDLRKNVRSLERLRAACEEAKLQLSDSVKATIQLDALVNGQDFNSSITRAKFEELCANYFNETLALVQKALKDANMKKTDIHNVLLVGGSTRIPKIQAMLKDFFGKDVRKSVNPDEAVAYGAAVQAAILQAKVEGIVLLDIIPLSLGVMTKSGEMSVLIKRNTPKPFFANHVYTTSKDDQQKVKIEIYEGERSLAKKNTYLNEFILTIPPLPKGVPHINVTFQVKMMECLK